MRWSRNSVGPVTLYKSCGTTVNSRDAGDVPHSNVPATVCVSVTTPWQRPVVDPSGASPMTSAVQPLLTLYHGRVSALPSAIATDLRPLRR